MANREASCEIPDALEDSPAGFVAYLALAAIVPLGVLAFRGRSAAAGALLLVLGATLFGPIRASFKLPLLPALGKESLAYLTVLAVFAVRHRSRIRQLRSDRIRDLLPVLAALGGIATSLTNTVPQSFGTRMVTHLPGMTLKDGLFMVATSAVSCLLPFVVGRAVVRDRDDLHTVLRAFAIAGLIYAPFAFLEMRLSPQLHAWAYGYHPHDDFGQTVRMGGYRPTLFMAHGLAVSLFFLIATLAMRSLERRERIFSVKATTWFWFLAFVVVTCKSTGSILYLALLLPLVVVASPRAQVNVAMTIAAFVLAYPALRAYDLVPVQRMLDLARVFGQERAESLFVRLYNEGLVLDHARERLLFGWGTYGRHLLYDAESGQSSIITDGAWIILVGMQGIFGMVTTIGTLLLSIALAFRRFTRVPPTMRVEVAGLALMVAITSLDLVPNGLFANYPFFLAGALTSAVGPVLTRERARRRAERLATEQESFVLDESATSAA